MISRFLQTKSLLSKNHTSVQVIIDSNLRFLDLWVGVPESTNDRHIWQTSTFYNLVQRKLRLNQPVFQTPFENIPKYLC